MEISDKALEVLTAPVNVEVLPHLVDGQLQGIGVRIRPYGRDYPKGIMVLGYGSDLQEALEECYDLAAANRWEAQDFAARPWAQPARVAASTFAAPTVAPRPTRAPR